MQNIFTQGGGAGIGSYVVVFKNGQLDPETNLLKLRNAYEAGESIFFSVIDAETKDALVPASGWLDEESKLHLVARDFDDAKTYEVVLTDAPAGSAIEVEVEVKDGIDIGVDSDLVIVDTIDDLSPVGESEGGLLADGLPAGDVVAPAVESEVVPGDPSKVYLVKETGRLYKYDAESEEYIVAPSATYLIWEMNVTLQSDSESQEGYRVSDFNGTINGTSFSSWEDFMSVVWYYGENCLPQLIMCHVRLLVKNSPQSISLTLPLFKDDSIQAWASHECRFIFAPNNNLSDSFEFAPFMTEDFLKSVVDAGQAVSVRDYPLWYGSDIEYINLVNAYGDDGPFIANAVLYATPEGAPTQIVTLLGGYQVSYIYNMDNDTLSATVIGGDTPTPEPTPEPTPATIIYQVAFGTNAWGWIRDEPDSSKLPDADDFDPALYKPDTLLRNANGEKQFGVMTRLGITRESTVLLHVFLYDDAQQYMPGAGITLYEDQNHTFRIYTSHLAIDDNTSMSFYYTSYHPQYIEGSYLPITDGWYWCSGDPMR